MDKKKKNHCDICHKDILGSSYKFKSHLYQHRAVKSRFKCSVCSKEFFRSDAYAKHISTHSGIAARKKYTCDHCDRSFVEKRNLIIHLKIHDEHVQVHYTCMACGTRYCEERLLKYHIRKAHFNLHSKGSTYVKKELNETWVERVKETDVCVQMTKVHNNVVTIKKFGTIKNDIDNNSKSVLNKNKIQFKEYITSVFARTDKSQYSRATCDYCKKEMLKKSLLSHIRERHLKQRRFRCEECSSTFNRHYQLVEHVCGKYRERKKTK